MSTLLKWLREALRVASQGLLALLFLFWIARLLYCVTGYVNNGTTGLKSAIAAHMQSLPTDLGSRTYPRWDLIAIKYVVIACVTLLLGILNRRVIADFWHTLRHGPPKVTNRP
jgi:hypothetical protein